MSKIGNDIKKAEHEFKLDEEAKKLEKQNEHKHSPKVEALKDEIENKSKVDLHVTDENSKAWKEDKKAADKLGKKINEELDKEAKEEAKDEKEYAKKLEKQMEDEMKTSK